MKQPYDWSKPIDTQNPLSLTRSSLRNQQQMGTVDKELYNQLVAKFNALNTEHSNLVEQQLQQDISSQTLSSMKKEASIFMTQSKDCIQRALEPTIAIAVCAKPASYFDVEFNLHYFTID